MKCDELDEWEWEWEWDDDDECKYEEEVKERARKLEGSYAASVKSRINDDDRCKRMERV